LPPSWTEREELASGAFAAERAAELPFVSKRRAEEADPEELADRPLLTPHPPSVTEARASYACHPLPDAAPHGRPIAIDELFLPGVYCKTQAAIAGLAAAVADRLERARQAARLSVLRAAADQNASAAERKTLETVLARHATHFPQTRVWGPKRQPEWARGLVWDCRDPTACVLLRPSGADNLVADDVNRTFFAREGKALDWPDAEMLRQIVGGGGVEGDSQCELATVVMRHRSGLRDNIGPVADSIDADAVPARGWISTGHGCHLPFVPGRCVAKNCVSKERYKASAGGAVSSVTKWRVTTDDSMGAVDPDGRSTGSRNDGLFREHWPPTLLPKPQTLAEAVAIVQTVARARGLKLGDSQAKRVTLWAIDLADAYRRLGVQFT